MINIYAGLIFLTAFASAASQILLNVSNGKKRKKKSIVFEYLNGYVISSYVILFCVLLINIYIMKFVPLKIAHTFAASTYIFVMFLSKIFLKEKITTKKIIGNVLIIIGIVVFIM